MTQNALLDVRNLAVGFESDNGQFLRAVDAVSLTVQAGAVVGLVGESGCGKSVTALAIMRLLPKPYGRILGGQILFKGQDLTKLSALELHQIRGNKIAMIFQEPMTALNPVKTIGSQLKEVFELHFPKLPAAAVQERSLALLADVGIPAPKLRLAEFPHQLSGGMRQRVMIAMALACEPDLLIADEPTTALDVTIQAQILDLIRAKQQQRGLAVLFITHSLSVVADLCDEVVVMYAGQVAEHAPMQALFHKPRHPYTQGLLHAVPRLGGKRKTALPIIPGNVPSVADFVRGCRFQTRCKYAASICCDVAPGRERFATTSSSAFHAVYCHRHAEIPHATGGLAE